MNWLDFQLLFPLDLLSRLIMKKVLLLFLGCAALLSITVSLHAQTGCTDSPENSTAVLALVGSAGAFFSTIRARSRARRNSSKR
jgi:XrtJ-associated TM-motif-TM protein